MKIRLLLLICLLIAALVLSVACQESNVARLGMEFSLHIREGAPIEGEKLHIKFLEVVTDSRCPKGVTCIWEGEVSCLVEIEYEESVHQIILTEPGLTSWPPREHFQEYEIAYQVEPYPVAGVEIAEEDYQLHLTVTKP